MAGVLIESFSGVTQGTLGTASDRAAAAQKLVGKYTSADSNLAIYDVGPCQALGNALNTGGWRDLQYDFAASEIDNFLVVGFHAYAQDVSSANGVFGSQFIALGASGEPLNENDLWLVYWNDGSIRVLRKDGAGYTAVAQSAAGLITDDDEFYYGAEILKHASAGTIKLFFNGDLVASAAGLDTRSDQVTSDTFSRVLIGAGGGGFSSSSSEEPPDTVGDWITSVFVFNSLGTEHRLYPGTRDVGVAFPAQDGPSEEFGPGDGNYALVDEKDVADGTDYITATTVGLEDLYFFTPVEGSGELDVVQLTARDQKTTGDSVYYSLRAHLSSTTGSPDIQSETSWTNGRYLFGSPPGGGDWSPGIFDSTAFGAQSEIVAGGELRIEQLYAEYLIETYTPTNCGEAGASDLISEYSDSDIILLSDIGPPNVPEHLISDTWDVSWVEEDPGGFMEGRVSFPLKIGEVSPINYFDDIYYTFEGVERYRGRVEKIDRRSDAAGEWLDCTLAGWIQNAQADRLYWGRIQDKRLDAWVGQAGVGPGGYVDQFAVSEVINGFPDGNPSPNIQITLPAGTNLGQPAGGVVQFDWQSDVYSPAPAIERIRFDWSIDNPRPGAYFQVVAYSPIGSYAPPTIIYEAAHTTGSGIVSLFVVGTSVSPPNAATIPVGTWRLLIRPYAFKQAVNTVPEPGMMVRMWNFSIGLLPTANPIRPAAVVEEVVTSSCPALDTSEIPTTDAAVVDGLVYETPTAQTEIFEEMLRYEPSGWTYWVREKLANDRYRFYFGPRSDTVWYEVEHVEIQGLGGEGGVVYNRATVSFVDYLGRQQTISKEQSVDILDDVSESIGLPFVREIHRDVGKLRGKTYLENVENATLIANQLLAESAEPAEVGQFRVIGKQVYDLVEAEYVDFRTLIPGRLIRVKDTGTGDAAIWRIQRLEKTLGMGMECQVVVGRGTSNLDALIARLQARELL